MTGSTTHQLALRKVTDGFVQAQILALVRSLDDAGLISLLRAMDPPRQLNLFRLLEREDLLRFERLCVPRTCRCPIKTLPCACTPLREFVWRVGAGADPAQAAEAIGRPVSMKALLRAERQVKAELDGCHWGPWPCGCVLYAPPCKLHKAVEPACELDPDVELALMELIKPGQHAEPKPSTVPSAAITTAAQADDMTDRETLHQGLRCVGDTILNGGQHLGIQAEHTKNGDLGIRGKVAGR